MWRGRNQRDFEDEIRSHLELEADRLIAEGMHPDDARLAARRRFGNVGSAQQRFRDARRFAWLEHVVSDARHALRGLRKTPGFTLLAVPTLTALRSARASATAPRRACLLPTDCR
jgi:putative ABC transport system permease protein